MRTRKTLLEMRVDTADAGDLWKKAKLLIADVDKTVSSYERRGSGADREALMLFLSRLQGQLETLLQALYEPRGLGAEHAHEKTVSLRRIPRSA